jgi:hypothetical protein
MAGADTNVIAKMNEAVNKNPESKPQPITIHKLVK